MGNNTNTNINNTITTRPEGSRAERARTAPLPRCRTVPPTIRSGRCGSPTRGRRAGIRATLVAAALLAATGTLAGTASASATPVPETGAPVQAGRPLVAVEGTVVIDAIRINRWPYSSAGRASVTATLFNPNLEDCSGGVCRLIHFPSTEIRPRLGAWTNVGHDLRLGFTRWAGDGPTVWNLDIAANNSSYRQVVAGDSYADASRIPRGRLFDSFDRGRVDVDIRYRVVVTERNPLVTVDLRRFDHMPLGDACASLPEFYAKARLEPRRGVAGPSRSIRVGAGDFDQLFTGYIGNDAEHRYRAGEARLQGVYGEGWVEVEIELWEDDWFGCGGGDDKLDLSRRRGGSKTLTLLVHTGSANVYTHGTDGSWLYLGVGNGSTMSVVAARNGSNSGGVTTYFTVDVT